MEDKAFYITYKDETLRKDVHAAFRFLNIENAKNIDKAWVYALKISYLEYTFKRPKYEHMVEKITNVLSRYFLEEYNYKLPALIFADYECSRFS